MGGKRTQIILIMIAMGTCGRIKTLYIKISSFHSQNTVLGSDQEIYKLEDDMSNTNNQRISNNT